VVGPGLICVLATSLALADGERGEATFSPTPAESAVPEPFRLGPARFPYDLSTVRDEPNYTVEHLAFPSPIETPDDANNTVHADYFRPKGDGQRPGVVVLHILGADFALSRYLAARLADRGVAALFVRLPYYGERRPAEANDRRFLSGDLDRSVRSMRQGVCDVRRAVAWLGGRPEIDRDRLGVAGISLGGIVSAVAAGVDPAIGSAALLLAGGDLATILWEMPEAGRYRKLWIDSGRTREDLQALTRPYDPITHAAGLRGKRVLMIAGRTDEVIPPSSATALWEAAGRPTLRWYDCGHYSAAGFLLPGMREVVEFFDDDGDRPAP